MQPMVIGVDGGTTKTIALVADSSGAILGAARGAGSNWSGDDVAVPMTVVAETVRAALKKAQVTAAEVDMAVFCLSGADWPEDHTRREAFLGEQDLARSLVVKNDAFGGLRAGTQNAYGVVIAVGTGANCAIIAPDGREWAYGYYVTYGGAGDIAREATHAVFRQEDGRGPITALTPATLELFGLPSVEALMRAIVAKQISRSRALSLCPLVFRLADEGDAAARGIIVRQATALVDYATNLIRRYDMQALAFDVVLAGSVFKGQGPLLIDTLSAQIRDVAPQARIVHATREPAVGALLLAYDALGWTVTKEMYERLDRTAPAPELFDTTDGGRISVPFTRR